MGGGNLHGGDRRGKGEIMESLDKLQPPEQSSFFIEQTRIGG
jgi:hypothetical protein